MLRLVLAYWKYGNKLSKKSLENFFLSYIYRHYQYQYQCQNQWNSTLRWQTPSKYASGKPIDNFFPISWLLSPKILALTTPALLLILSVKSNRATIARTKAFFFFFLGKRLKNIWSKRICFSFQAKVIQSFQNFKF